MRTTLDLPVALVEEAKKVSGVKTKTQAIILALQEFIQRKNSRRILELRGSMSGAYNYKELRRKRNRSVDGA